MGVRAFGTQRRFTTSRARLRLPRAVAAVSAAGLCAGVTLLGAGTAQAATGFGVTATIGVQINPDAVAVDSSTGTVYVANAGNGSVSVIPANNNGGPRTVTKNIGVGGANADAVAVDSSTGTVYVATGTSAVCGPPNNSAPGCENSVWVIDMSGREPNTGTVIATIPVGTNPDAVAVDPATRTVYVVNAGDGTVSAIDESTNKVTGTPIRVGANPDAVAVDPATRTVYVANAGDGTVSVIDESTNKVTGTPIRVGANPDAVAVDPATHTVYVTNNAHQGLREDPSVSVINGNQVTNIPLGFGGILRGVAVDPATHNVYVTDADDGSVSVIDESANQVTGPAITVGANPDAVAVDPATHNVYVANTTDGTVSVISPEVSPTITGTPDPATVDTPYAYQFTVTGSPAPTVTATSGMLPPGIGMSPDGLLEGIPTTPGTYTFTVTANNGFDPPASLPVTMIVSLPRPSPPKITGSPDDAYLRAPYSYQFTVTGFPVPTVALAPGTPLPPGLTLHADGTLTGTPTKAGTYTITVIASNSTGPDDKESFDLTVSPLHKPPPPPPCHPHFCV